VNCFLCELVCPEKAIEVVFITPKANGSEAPL
jgi:NAD-dependent dihydropyrimidine dehydrogenase PreA subunit